MVLFLSLGVFVFLSASLIFIHLARTQRHFRYLAALALLQTVDFLLYFFPDDSVFATQMRLIMFGSFYLYGPLLLAFMHGFSDKLFLGLLSIQWHWMGSGCFAVLTSLAFYFSMTTATGFVTPVTLDMLTLLIPLSILFAYQINILRTLETNDWPSPIFYRSFQILSLMIFITLLLHMALLVNWLPETLRLIIPALFAIFVYGFFMVILLNLKEIQKALKTKSEGKLTKTERQSILSLMHDYLLQSAVFKNCDLKLQDFAKALGVSEKKISESINIEAGSSFQTFINKYRLAYLTEQLSINNKGVETNLLELALEAGFGSKTSFNRCFKAEYGVTPRDWIRLSMDHTQT